MAYLSRILGVVAGSSLVSSSFFRAKTLYLCGIFKIVRNRFSQISQLFLKIIQKGVNVVSVQLPCIRPKEVFFLCLKPTHPSGKYV